jgi:hypothetical protein
MSLLHQFLSVDQLRRLDPQQFEILKNALTHAIRTNDQVQRALRRVIEDVFDQLTRGTPQTPTQPPEAPPAGGRPTPTPPAGRRPTPRGRRTK